MPAVGITALSAEEKARGEANFSPLVAQVLVANGRFRVSADTLEMVELFQGVARRVGEMLQRPVVSGYAGTRAACAEGGSSLILLIASLPACHPRLPRWNHDRTFSVATWELLIETNHGP